MPADGGPNLPLQRAAKAEISRHGGAQERQAGSLCEHERCDACTEAIVMIVHTPAAGSLESRIMIDCGRASCERGPEGARLKPGTSLLKSCETVCADSCLEAVFVETATKLGNGGKKKKSGAARRRRKKERIDASLALFERGWVT